MSAPPSSADMMYSPASAESVAAVRDRVSDARSDLLVGQGQILKNNGDNTSAILRDANNNAQFANANIERTSLAGMQEGNRNTERLAGKADTIAWNENGLRDAGFAAGRAQNERINEAQSAMADRAAKYNADMTSNSFARLSAQGENGFARELDATTNGTRQVVQSEMGVTRSLGDGFREGSAALAANYTSLSAQNFGTRELIGNSANRNSDQTAAILATLSAQHSNQTRDFLSATRDLATQAANNAAAGQLEGAKNWASSQIQATVNAKDAALQAAINSKEAVLQAAVNSKEGVLQASFLAKDALLENSKWFALAEKTAMVNKLDTDSKLADVKDTVIVTSNATQALILGNEATRVRDALAVAATENVFLRHRHHDHHHEHRHRADSPRRRGDSPPRR